METRDKIILGVVFAGLAALAIVELSRRQSITIAAPGAPETPVTDMGPAAAWANVPATRYVLPIGTYGMTPSNTMYSCGGLCQ